MSGLKNFLLVTVGLVILFHVGSALFTSWFIVEESENAVVEFRGKPTSTITTSGPHFKLPFPYSTVQKVSLETRSMTFGYTEEDGKSVGSSDAKMITGDENIILADAVVQWKVSDPQKYFYTNSDPKTALYNATSSALRSVIGSSTVDDALTSGKESIEQKTWEKLSEQLQELDMGISVSTVRLQDVELPTPEVRKAFTDVTDAREAMNTKINEANKYESEKTNEAAGTVDAKISIAEGNKTKRIEEAKGATAIFDALYKEYAKNKTVTRERLTKETLQKVLKDADITIMKDNGDTVKYLPIMPTTPAK